MAIFIWPHLHSLSVPLLNGMTFPLFWIVFTALLFATFSFVPIVIAFFVAYFVSLVGRLLLNKKLPVPPQSAVFITGCSSGIGYDMTMRLSQLGFVVFATVRRQEDADRLKAKSNELFKLPEVSNSQIIPIICDVASNDSVEKAKQEVLSTLSQRKLNLYGVVNVAGVCSVNPIATSPMEDIESQFQTNLLGSIRVTKAFLSVLHHFQYPGRTNRIVFTSSLLGSFPCNGVASYGSSKAGIDYFSDALSQEVPPHSISVSKLKVGAIETEIYHKMDSSVNKTTNDSKSSTNGKLLSAVQHSYSNAASRVNAAFQMNPKSKVCVVTDAAESALLDSIPQKTYLTGGPEALVIDLFSRIVPYPIMDFLVQFTFHPIRNVIRKTYQIKN